MRRFHAHRIAGRHRPYRHPCLPAAAGLDSRPGLAQRAACLSQLRQQSVAWRIYLDDHERRFPDRRDPKSSLPGGCKPWAIWPPSDPRADWAALVLSNEPRPAAIWNCPAAAASSLAKAEPARQANSKAANAPVVRYYERH